MSTDFLDCLQQPDMGSRATRVAQVYVTARGLGYIHPFGVEVYRGRWVYFYRVDNGVLELEVLSGSNGEYTLGDRDFITDEADLEEMLGDSNLAPGPDR